KASTALERIRIRQLLRQSPRIPEKQAGSASVSTLDAIRCYEPPMSNELVPDPHQTPLDQSTSPTTTVYGVHMAFHRQRLFLASRIDECGRIRRFHASVEPVLL